MPFFRIGFDAASLPARDTDTLAPRRPSRRRRALSAAPPAHSLNRGREGKEGGDVTEWEEEEEEWTGQICEQSTTLNLAGDLR